ncbi:MAG: hypothetical protein AAFR56_08720 [Chloroflexota bacterium]
MLQPVLRAVLSVSALLLLLIAGVRIGYGVVYPAQSTPELFTYPDCDTPCWNGLRPGDTMDRVLGVLDEQQIASDTALHERDIRVNFMLPSGEAQTVIFEFRNDDTLGSIRLFMTRICLREVIAAHGLPEIVLLADDGEFSSVSYYDSTLTGTTQAGKQQHLMVLRALPLLIATPPYEPVSWRSIPEVNLRQWCL